MSEWKPIETVPKDDDWIGKVLLAKPMSWGWAIWVGQCDAGEWLSCYPDGDDMPCADTEKPTHWQPLPEPPEITHEH